MMAIARVLRRAAGGGAATPPSPATSSAPALGAPAADAPQDPLDPRMECPNCGQALFPDSTRCVNCGQPTRFDPCASAFVVGDPCANAELIDCNWVAPAEGELCLSCALTRTSPDQSVPEAVAAWARAELQKRRVVLQLLGLGLPVVSHREKPEGGLAFDLLYSTDGSVTTGHQDGVITIDVGESDDARRARLRQRLGERYRTMLGHFRHEIGHYYWPSLAGRDDNLAQTRALFGDERLDYAQALQEHYAKDESDPARWQDSYVSEYATAHPWEDWAETFAHVLHIVGVMSAVERFGLRLRGDRYGFDSAQTVPPGPRAEMSSILDSWLPLSVALNAINRAMGIDDLYPFVLSPAVRQKLEYVHDQMRTAPSEPPEF